MPEQNLVSQPPFNAPFVDNNGLVSKAWAVWFRDLYKRTSFKGGNAIDDNQNSTDESLLTVNASLDQNTVATNQNTASISDHEALAAAHGSNGDVVGDLDLAEEALVGLVMQMALLANAVASTVSVTSADVAAAPATYSQSHTDTIVTLANESKADINILVTDVNNAITKINDILAGMISSGQMNNA